MTTTQLSEIYVQDYGAAGDGIADDTLALQAALTIGISAGKVIIFEAGKTYKTTAELRVGIGAGAYARLEGRGATISCNAPSPVRSVLAIINDVAIIQDLFATGNGTANSGIFLQRGSTSQFTNVHTYTTLVDGFTSFADNDRCHYKNCSARVCGQLFHTTGYAGPAPAYIRRLVSGTVAKTSGTSCIITGTDTYFLKTGARSGDFISMHAMSPGNTSAEWLQIHSVDSDTQISCKTHPASKGAASGLLYSIHVGDGYHEGPGRADNNINQIDNFLAENTAGAGIKTGGLYGVRVTNLQVNAAGSYPVVIASNDLQSIGSVFIGVYFELCAAANNFFLGGAAGITIDTANVTGNPVVASSGFNWGTVTNQQNAGDPGRIDPVEATSVSYIPVKKLAIDALMKGRVQGRAYTSADKAGMGSITIADNINPAVQIVSGIEPPAGGANADSVAHDLNTATNVTNGLAEINLLTKHLLRCRNAGDFKFGIGFLGDVRTVSTDTSDMPGTATIHKPSGRFTLEAGTKEVTILNKLCVASTKVFLSKKQNDTTAIDFKVIAGAGNFVVTANATATSSITFDFFIVNVGL